MERGVGGGRRGGVDGGASRGAPKAVAHGGAEVGRVARGPPVAHTWVHPRHEEVSVWRKKTLLIAGASAMASWANYRIRDKLSAKTQNITLKV